MSHIGYAAMLEQFPPRELVGFCEQAEAAGFSGVMAADHIQPWTPQQGNASFVWSFMTAAAEHTRGDIGPGVTCPSFRSHPAIIAQAAATMAAMYPGRFWLGLGSGEALNEHIVGGYWPEVAERINRMFESIDIIRKLFTGKDVKHAGAYYKMETMRLWTMPEQPSDLCGHRRAGYRGEDGATVRWHHHGLRSGREDRHGLRAIRERRTRGRPGSSDAAQDPPTPSLVGADR